MKIDILGPGCRNCVTVERLARESAAELGIDAEITKVTDYADIASYGIMSTPGLVLDGEVVVSGRVPSAAEVTELLAARAG
jgi:small redox-active disulfide protein 2